MMALVNIHPNQSRVVSMIQPQILMLRLLRTMALASMKSNQLTNALMYSAMHALPDGQRCLQKRVNAVQPASSPATIIKQILQT
jgi:hypothetical protein